MTVICWDGHTLAADKMADVGGLRRSVTKAHRIQGCLTAYAGSTPHGEEMLDWFKRGAKPADFPPSQRDNENWAGLLAITPDGEILKFENTPFPVRFDHWQTIAIGSGRDYAMASMHLGKSAQEAVEIACLFDTGCGNGVDTLTF